jgi:hypothetical protein
MEEKLPGFVIAQLFGNELVDVGDVPVSIPQPEKKTDTPPQTSPEKPSKNFLGNYEKKIIVLVDDADNVYLDEKNLDFLSGILNACHLNIGHIALMNFHQQAVAFNQLKKDMQPVCLIAFGVDTLQLQLPFDMPQYQVQDYNSCKILTAPSLTVLNQPTNEAKTEKLKLWQSLQNIFSIGK